jgi:hypothetical protein
MPEIPASTLDANPFIGTARGWWPPIAHLPWIEVPANGNL